MKPGSIMVPVLDPVTSLLTSPLFNATVVAAIEIVKTVQMPLESLKLLSVQENAQEDATIRIHIAIVVPRPVVAKRGSLDPIAKSISVALRIVESMVRVLRFTLVEIFL